MKDFNFVSPTKIYFGKNALSYLSNEFKNYKKVLLVYGQSSIKKNGLYDEVVKQLLSAKTEYFEVSGVRPNPDIGKVKDGLKLPILNQCCFL